MMSMLISSKDNQTIKEIKKLKESKYRKEKFIVEGFKMLQEAVNEGADIEIVVVKTGNKELLENVNKLLGRLNQGYETGNELIRRLNQNNEAKNEPMKNQEKKNELLAYRYGKRLPRIIEVTENVFMQLTDVKTPQGVLAVIRKNVEDNVSDFEDENENKNDALKDGVNSRKIDCLSKINTGADYILAVDGVQDPGNLGTIIRTADSANLKQILVSKDTVDAYSPKVIRSTMGSIYRVKIVECENLADVLNELKKHKFQIVSTSLDTENSIYDIDYRKKVVVIGNEGNGVSKKIQDLSDYKVKIPMLGKTESLNASVATGIMIYEYVRQMCSKK
jgi:TrmH family RNA methyltransferase